MKMWALIVALLCALTSPSQQRVSCISDRGDPVDWWVILKLPNQFYSGRDFMYYDSNNPPQLMKEINLPDPNSPLFRTLSQVADQTTQQTASVFWNDQPPNEPLPPFSFAHQKGFLGFDQQGAGFIMIHSAPNFVSVVNGKAQIYYPPTSLKYGQHFLCISTDSFATYNNYGELLLVDRPYVYNSSIPAWAKPQVPQLVKLLDNNASSSERSQVDSFKSAHGMQFTKFAKSGKWSANFYASVVAPYYKSNMAIETWGQGTQGLMPPDCGQYKVVSNLNIDFTPDIAYTYYDDHSKYGISLDGPRHIVCFGDINR